MEIDWETWRKIYEAQVWEFVALMAGLNPRDIHHFQGDFYNFDGAFHKANEAFRKYLDIALSHLGHGKPLQPVSYDDYSPHTFATQWVLAGGSIMRLSKILGHSSVDVTEYYAHLLPDSFREAEFGMLKADLAPSAGFADIANRATENGACSYVEATQQEARAAQAV